MVLNNQMALTAYSPLYDPLVIGFGVSETWVIILQTMPHVSFFPMSFVVSLMFKKMKKVNVFRCSPIIMLLGAWLRLFAFTGNNPFWVLLAANTFFTLGAPILLNGLSIVTIAWFREKEKNLATAVIATGATLGGLIGNAIPGVYSAGLNKEDPVADLRVLRETIFAQNCIVSVLCILFLVLFRAKPKNFPSQLAFEADSLDSKKHVKGQRSAILAALCSNKDFICNCFIFVTIFGTLTSFPVFLSNLFKPGNYSTSDLSLIGALSIAGGMFGSLFTGIILDKTQAYLCVSRLQTFSCALL